MTLYYVKQDNTVWGCGEPGCCGEYSEEVIESFIDCDHLPVTEMTAAHLHICAGGGPVLKWRKAKRLELLAWTDGHGDGFEDGWSAAEKKGETNG